MANRKHGKIDQLNPKLKAVVEEMLMEGSTYREIVEYLKDHEVSISIGSVCRHAQRMNANIQELRMAQENARIMMDEMARYPDLDTTEAIVRLLSSNLFQRLANTDEEAWNDLRLDKALQQTVALIRATAYKKQIDIKNQDTLDLGYEEIKSKVFAKMSKDDPMLYKQLVTYLKNQKESD